MSEIVREITRESTSDKFLARLMQVHFKKEQVNTFLEEHKSAFDYQELKEFLESELISNILENQWEYESDEKWEGRTTERAIWETVVHGLGILQGDAELFSHAKETIFLKNYKPEEIELIGQKTNIICNIFEESLPKPSIGLERATERLEKAIKAARIINEFDARVAQVVLFGADDGEYSNSDIDLGIIVEGNREKFPFRIIPAIDEELENNGFTIGTEQLQLHLFFLDEQAYLGNEDESVFDEEIQKIRNKIRQGTPLLEKK